MALEGVVEIVECGRCQAVNSDLAAFILSLPVEAFTRRSHFFHGRYENLYLAKDAHPGLLLVLEQAQSHAAQLLDSAPDQLKLGFWFNIMQKGDVTTLHSHDDDDELLSAVYYLQVPEHSGQFRIHHKGEISEIKPAAGNIMFFDPAMPHEVAEHQSELARISIGINFGPVT